MESKDITVTLAPGHEVTLTTDAPDIKGLVDEIVKVKDILTQMNSKLTASTKSLTRKALRKSFFWRQKIS